MDKIYTREDYLYAITWGEGGWSSAGLTYLVRSDNTIVIIPNCDDLVHYISISKDIDLDYINGLPKYILSVPKLDADGLKIRLSREYIAFDCTEVICYSLKNNRIKKLWVDTDDGESEALKTIQEAFYTEMGDRENKEKWWKLL